MVFLSSPPPKRGPWRGRAIASSLPTWLLALICSTLVWGSLAFVLVFATYIEYARKGKDVHLLKMLSLNMPMALPLVLVSWQLYLYLSRHPEVLEQRLAWMRMGAVALLSLGFTVAVNCAVLYLNPPPGSVSQTWLQILLARSFLDNFVDAFIVSSALAFQIAFTIWQRNQAQRVAMQQALTDNLGLRLTLLQGQLEPHFLFNTLNGISSLVRAGERGQALSALTRVSELLRYALRVSKLDWVSVQDELDFVRDYLALQSLRFGDGLQLEWQIEARDWTHLACPPLLLQPLIENAIRHGLEAGAGQGLVVMSLCADVGWVRLRIENGVGDGPSRLNGHGVGLSATRERLAMLFGAAAVLQTYQEQGRFIVELCLPRRELNDDVDRTDS